MFLTIDCTFFLALLVFFRTVAPTRQSKCGGRHTSEGVGPPAAKVVKGKRKGGERRKKRRKEEGKREA
jgi:hypothetical protein